MERVLLIAGGGLPAELEFSSVIAALESRAVDALAKDLEVFSGPTPPPGYSLDTEIDGALRAADARGWGTFHLVGYSGGGAVALAFAAAHPERLLSLALFEPAWAGNWGWTDRHQAYWHELSALESLPPFEFLPAFLGLHVKPGVVVSPPFDPSSPPPWMSNRPAGITAIIGAFRAHELDRAALGRFEAPVYYALGGLSNQDGFGEIATKLASVFPNFTLEEFPDRHHLDPPHLAEPERVAASLLALWADAHDAQVPQL
ncbi:MAG: alpha/beta hydrolase [Sinomonas sp.]|nr:alpha/beta hydrolase [Sinomonas sp.]